MKTIHRNGMKIKCGTKILPPTGYSAITLLALYTLRRQKKRLTGTCLPLMGESGSTTREYTVSRRKQLTTHG